MHRRAHMHSHAPTRAARDTSVYMYPSLCEWVHVSAYVHVGVPARDTCVCQRGTHACASEGHIRVAARDTSVCIAAKDTPVLLGGYSRMPFPEADVAVCFFSQSGQSRACVYMGVHVCTWVCTAVCGCVSKCMYVCKCACTELKYDKHTTPHTCFAPSSGGSRSHALHATRA